MALSRLDRFLLVAAVVVLAMVMDVQSANQPYRTAYHFQPRKNWMNDPNGPMYYKGWYHFFYQYNRAAAVWGNITWGHAVSRDLVHWRHLHTALKGDHWYDTNGIWSGSATLLLDGTPALLYTGLSNSSHQMQSMAVPENVSDALLRRWHKSPHNPVAVAPRGYNSSQFRDPTTAWRSADGVWKMLVGAVTGVDKLTGQALLFTSKDFQNWSFSGKAIRSLPETGMWECPDFYPVTLTGRRGVETSAMGPKLKHVLKVSSDLKKHDYYSVGTYNATTDTYTGEDKQFDIGLGLRYDYGKFYASKSFFDQNKGRRVLWGWANESSSVQDDIDKSWSSVQCMPRQVWLDPLAPTSLVQWPVAEVDALRQNAATKKNVVLEKGSTVELPSANGAQLDIEVAFAMPKKREGVEQANEQLTEDGALHCSQIITHANYSYGPFGVHVLATDDLRERTSIFFYVTHDGNWKTLFCSDHKHAIRYLCTWSMHDYMAKCVNSELRVHSSSSLQQDVDKTTYGSYVRVHKSDNALTLRILVDHSIVESFAQDGRTVITSRVYPEFAINDSARTFLFNNGSQSVTVKSVTTWDMPNVHIKDF